MAGPANPWADARAGWHRLALSVALRVEMETDFSNGVCPRRAGRIYDPLSLPPFLGRRGVYLFSVLK